MSDKDLDDEPTGGDPAVHSPPISPQLARSQRATAEAWRRIRQEFGLLEMDEVADLLGAAPAASKLLGVRLGDDVVFPGYQFDRATRAVRSLIEPLLALARDNGWSNESLALWLMGPSTSFGADSRPVDHMGDDPEAVLANARDTMEALW